MLMQTFGVTNKEHYGMLWYFLEWSIGSVGQSVASSTKVLRSTESTGPETTPEIACETLDFGSISLQFAFPTSFMGT